MISPPRSDEEFLARFGDTIDDRIAEILDELLDQRDAARRRRQALRALGPVIAVLALAASILLRPGPVAWGLWSAAAIVSLVQLAHGGQAARRGRPRLLRHGPETSRRGNHRPPRLTV